MIEAILGGIAVGIGSVAFMVISDGSMLGNIIGALCYAVILLAIEYYDLDLFVGRAGLLNNKNNDPIELILIYFGNFIGVSWVAFALKLVPKYGEQIGKVSHIMLQTLEDMSWDTCFVTAILCGMMMYAGIMVFKMSNTWAFFAIAIMTCVLAQWPFAHVIYFCLWSDSWDYWYLIIPTTLGNIIGANVWGMLRRRSPRYKNKDKLTPDSYDIADRFHDFV